MSKSENLFPSMEHSIQEVVDVKTETLHEYVERLENALRFYADSDNYKSFSCGPDFVTQVEMDGGERARKAIFNDNDK